MMKDMVKSIVVLAGGLVAAEAVVTGMKAVVKVIEKKVENSKKG